MWRGMRDANAPLMCEVKAAGAGSKSPVQGAVATWYFRRAFPKSTRSLPLPVLDRKSTRSLPLLVLDRKSTRSLPLPVPDRVLTINVFLVGCTQIRLHLPGRSNRLWDGSVRSRSRYCLRACLTVQANPDREIIRLPVLRRNLYTSMPGDCHRDRSIAEMEVNRDE